MPINSDTPSRLGNLPTPVNLVPNHARWPRWRLPSLRQIGQFELVAAAIKRCDEILARLNPSEDDKPAVLHSLLEREDDLRSYLEASHHDPVVAFACAKGDAVYLEHLRSSGWLASPRELAGKLIIPILLLLLTATLGNWVGNRLQENSFRRNRSFEVKLERLREGQKVAAEIYSSLRPIHFRIQRDEEAGELTWRPQTSLQRHRTDLEKARMMAAGLNNSNDISNALQRAAQELNDYISCLEGRVQNTKSNCAGEYRIESLLDVEDAFSHGLVSFLEQNR
jgi:hypothetical protein